MRNDHFADAGKVIVVPAWRPGPDDAARRDTMKTLAGGIEIDDRVYADPYPNTDRSTISDSAVEAFLAKNTFYCQAFSARIKPEQCKLNRANNNYVCGKCTQDKPDPAAVKKAKPAKRRKGDNPESPWRQNPVMIRKDIRKEILI